MLHSADKLRGTRLEAVDGEVGKVKDLYFDDVSWSLRYFVVDTGHWLSSRQVLISPDAVTGYDLETGRLVTSLTRSEVEESPPISEHEPVSRQYEARLASYYGWTPYWSYGLTPGAGMYTYPIIGGGGAFPYPLAATPGTPAPESREIEEIAAREREQNDPHLRSNKEVDGYHILAKDGEIGHIKDFLIHGGDWKISHLVVDTRNWIPGRKVVIDIGWVSDIDWVERQASVDLTRSQIESSPEFDEDVYLDHDYETEVGAYYGSLAKARTEAEPKGPRYTSESSIY
jgi:hypothetical protein